MQATNSAINLTTTPDTVIWPAMHYVFIEKIGPFQTNAAQAWTELHRLIPQIQAHNKVGRYFSLYRMELNLYRAGVSVDAEPSNLPAGVAYEALQSGHYARFTLTGSYAQLPEATGRAFAIVSDSKLPLRDDFNIENYVNDPRSTPEDQLITEILFPSA